MNEKTLHLLEFDAIRQRVAACALSEESVVLIQEETPLSNPQAVHDLKSLVRAVFNRIISTDEEKRDQLPVISTVLPKLSVEGTVLELDEAYALAIFVDRAAVLTRWLSRDASAVLREAVAGVPDCTAVSREIFRVLDKDGKLRDLPEFQEINRRIRALRRDLEASIGAYSANEDTRRMLQSTVPSQRDGRMVVAVKANFRGRINGIVHEVSSTGQTLFVEPAEVVEKNNEITVEQQRLSAEIHRVLRQMTGKVAEHQHSLKILHDKIVMLEVLRAKARYAYETKGIFAGLSDAITLKKARHPLLGRAAVPIDFSMGAGTITAIITGPNTGGKTVALKTVGLFAVMNQFGLAVPANEGTMLPVFDGVYADIGDEQSLSQSLSTFSAHITNIAGITGSATVHSLVLLDELGSGTDPEEGSALAMAILDNLLEKQVRLITTTHHGVLKNYGWTHAGVENASVDFDLNTLSPTYRIVMGIPGESRALEIAARNGLPQDIVQKARSYLDEKRTDVSALIAGLKQRHQEMDAAESAKKQEENQLREERRKADLRELRLRQKEVELKAGATGKLHALLTESRKQLENLVREIKEGELTREKTLKVKEFLHNLEEVVAASDVMQEAEYRTLSEVTRSIEVTVPEPTGSTLPLAPGCTVVAGAKRSPGTVLRADKKGFWIVEIGSVNMRFHENDLVVLSPEKLKVSIAPVELLPGTHPAFELNLLGMRLDDALDSLRRQIDAAVLTGYHEFSIIHGKGDGILRRGVHEFLQSQPAIAEFHFSRPELGGFGRTEVVLK
jgi:DNA mismatch repair protein MutS2